MSDINDLLNKVSAVPPAKKARVDNNSLMAVKGYPILDVLITRMKDIKSIIDNNSKGRSDNDEYIQSIEIEARVGMIINGSRRWQAKTSHKRIIEADDQQKTLFNNSLCFKSGVDVIFAKKLRKKLSSQSVTKTFSSTEKPLQILRSNSTGNRWEVDSKGNILMSEKKEAFIRYDFGLLSHDYDIRFDAATEKANSANDNSKQSNINYDEWTMERRKRRITYASASKDIRGCPWKIELTYVDVIDKKNKRNYSEIELEFELNENMKTIWLNEKNEGESFKYTRFIADQLLFITDFLIPSDASQFLGVEEEPLEVWRDQDVVDQIHRINISIYNPSSRDLQYLNNNKTFDFLGSMPVNLTRQNLISVQNNDYYLTEKSDGVRYLLYIVEETSSKSPIAVLVDRSKTVFKFRGCREIGKALGYGTVLDGELVFNRSYKDNLFLVFDTLLWKHISYMNSPFATRLELIKNDILTHYGKNIVINQTKPKKDQPIGLVRKTFIHKSEGVKVLLDRITQDDSGDYIYYDTNRRHHKTDGIIFQPNAVYVMSRNFDLLKWKWPELRSIDLAVTEENNAYDNSVVLNLKCAGPDNVEISCTKRGDMNVGLGTFDSYRLLADMSATDSRRKIVEVSYDTSIGMWSYVHLRKDKNQPNFIDAVFGVFMEQAEAISIEELEYVLNCSTHNLNNSEDFSTVTGRMRRQVIENQRVEINKKPNS